MAESKDGMGTDLQPSSNDAMTHDQHDPPHAMPGLIQGGSSFVLHNNLLPSDSLWLALEAMHVWTCFPEPPIKFSHGPGTTQFLNLALYIYIYISIHIICMHGSWLLTIISISSLILFFRTITCNKQQTTYIIIKCPNGCLHLCRPQHQSWSEPMYHLMTNDKSEGNLIATMHVGCTFIGTCLREANPSLPNQKHDKILGEREFLPVARLDRMQVQKMTWRRCLCVWRLWAC